MVASHSGAIQHPFKSTARWLKHGQNWVSQQDNNPKHTSKQVFELIKQANDTFLKWHSQSPDHSPIENMWTMLKRQTAIISGVCIYTLGGLEEILNRFKPVIKDVCCSIIPLWNHHDIHTHDECM